MRARINTALLATVDADGTFINHAKKNGTFDERKAAYFRKRAKLKAIKSLDMLQYADGIENAIRQFKLKKKTQGN